MKTIRALIIVIQSVVLGLKSVYVPPVTPAEFQFGKWL